MDPAIFHLTTILLISALSLWANHEASKGFQIKVLRAPTDTPAARRYNLMFVSNGAAARRILSVSASIERTLFPIPVDFPRKPIRSMTLMVASDNLSRAVVVTGGAGDDYEIHLSSNVMDEGGEEGVKGAICNGVGRVWVWDGRGTAPEGVVEGMVGYMCGVGRFVGYCEERRKGFVARLNREMEETWEDGMWDRAFGNSVTLLCPIGNVSTKEIVQL